MRLVSPASAGPPVGGLYLKPPSAGGLCDGVTTIPSALASCARFQASTARDTAGVGVKPPPFWMNVVTPFAVNTSRAVRNAGSDRAWVSMPRNSGPVTPFSRRASHTAWVTAAICSSLKLRENDEPLCPDVPKDTRCAGSSGSGFSL